MNAVDIEAVTVVYDYKPVLFNINLGLPHNKLIAIVGPNGAGKSTLIKTILNLIKPITGKVTFPLLVHKKNTIAYVPQSGSVDWDFPTTVFDVVMMGCYGKIGLFKYPTKKDKQHVLECLKKVGMEQYKDQQISALSGGQQQRIFLARALVQQADIYFFDEPLKGVDAISEVVIMNELKQLQKEGKTVIVVHHDLLTVEQYFDYVVLIHNKIIDSGPIESVFTKENIQLTYHSIVKEEDVYG